MRALWRLFTGGILVLAAALPATGVLVDSFRLESVKTGRVFGPFEAGEGVAISIETGPFRIALVSKNSISFDSLETGERFGPHDFTEGRIVQIGPNLFTFMDVKPIPREDTVQSKIPVAPVKATAPARPPEPPPRTVAPPTPKLDTPPVTPAPPKPPAPPELPPVVKPPPRVRAPVTASVQAPAAVRKPGPPPQKFFELAELGVELDVLDSTDYDAAIRNASSSSTVATKRQAVSAFLATDALRLQFGLLFNGEWDDSLAGDGDTYANAKLTDGSGWRASLELRRRVFLDGPWRVDVLGSVTYSREDYRLKYGVWQSSQTEISGTNGAPPIIETEWDYENATGDATLSETLLRLGGDLSYRQARWGCHAGIAVLAFSDTDLKAAIEAQDQRYEIEMDRTYPIAVTAGVNVDRRAIRYFAGLELGSSSTFRLGLSRQL